MADNLPVAPPAGLEEFIATPIEQPIVDNTAPNQTPGAPAGLDAFVEPELKAEKYGTTGQMVKTALEGAGKGLLGPVATGLELAAGVKPEDIRGREEVNPVTHGVAEMGTFLGSALLGTGEAAILSKMGKAAEVATGLGKGGKLSQIAAEGVNAAFQGALFQGGEELHKRFVEDPTQTSDSVITHLGMSTVLGGLFGGAVGAAFRKASPEAAERAGQFVSELDMPAVEAGNLSANIKAADNIKPGKKAELLDAIKLNKEKPTAPQTRKDAKLLGITEIPDGALLDNPLVQTQLDSLIHSPYTVAGDRVGSKFRQAWGQAEAALEGAINSGPAGSKAELGNALKDSISSKVRTEYKPIQEGFDAWAAEHGSKEISNRLIGNVKEEFGMIPEFRVSPSSPQGGLVRQVLKDIDNVKTLNDLKIVKDGLALSKMASSEERRMVGILRDKLSDIEEKIIGQKNPMAPVYKKYISKIGTLSEKLGKGTIHGTEDALRFMGELEPEKIAQRIFSKNDSEFLNFFSKEFPEEFQMVRNFQRADLRDQAVVADVFDPKKFFPKFNKLEPEVQKALYSPEEIKKIVASEGFIRNAFPKDYNGSHTAHALAQRAAFESPQGLVKANFRDYAVEKGIQLAAMSAEAKQAIELGQATVKGENLAARSIKAVFDGAKNTPLSIVPAIAARAKLDKLVTKAVEDPARMVAMNDNNNSVPEYSAALSASAARVVQYLSSIKPNTSPVNPLDGKRVPSSMEKAAYDRALDIAEQPLVVLNGLKDGRITPSDVAALKTMYPNVYNRLSTRINEQIVEQTHKGKIIPYKTRIGLSIFLGRPLDSTMTPAAIIDAQPKPEQAPPTQTGMAKGYQAKGIQKLPGQYQTPEQAREAHRLRK